MEPDDYADYLPGSWICIELIYNKVEMEHQADVNHRLVNITAGPILIAYTQCIVLLGLEAKLHYCACIVHSCNYCRYGQYRHGHTGF